MTQPAALSATDFIKAAKSLKCDVSAIRAVAEVESRGAGFVWFEDESEYRPKALFERHIMYRRYKTKHGSSAALEAVRQYPASSTPAQAATSAAQPSTAALPKPAS